MQRILLISALVAGVLSGGIATQQSSPGDTLSSDTAGRFAALALACVQQEYPNKITHVLNSAADAKPPHELTPAFYGCYDWHSVGARALAARAAGADVSGRAVCRGRAAPRWRANITAAHIAGEVAYLNGTGRETFERPYGLAWLLQLAAELREWDIARGPRARRSARAARIRRGRATQRVAAEARLSDSRRRARADGVRVRPDARLGARARSGARNAARSRKLREFHLKDRDCPIGYEPSGQDFLSPCLAEADVMRRVLPPAEFATWLTDVPAALAA